MEQEVVVYQEQAIGLLAQKPSEALAQAGEAAQALKAVIAMKPKPVIINGQQYLELEDWQTIARFYGLAARVTGSSLVHIESVMGWEATADVVHVATGKVISSGVGMCLNDEDRWGDRPLFQLRSMAQTRACGKAFRSCLAWVVVMAGYRPTPAEEMTGAEQPRDANTDGPHFCKEHGVKFFKTAKMRGYAHRIGETGQWCNEHTEQAPATAPTSEGKPPVVEGAMVGKAEAILFDEPSDLTPLKRFYALAQEFMGTQDTVKVSAAFAKQHEGHTPEQVDALVLEHAIAAINSSMAAKKAMK